MAQPDNMNDHHVPTRPGWVVYIGLVVVFVAVITIMLANKVVAPVVVGSEPHSTATVTAA